MEKLLEEIGLTKGEVAVYLSLLKVGESTTGRIIDEANLSSGKIYEILNKLIKKGLVSYIIKEKTKYFSATAPSRLLDYLQEKEIELKEKEIQLREKIPQLVELQDFKKSQQEATLYTGYRGIESAIHEALREMSQNQEVLAMGLTARKDEVFNRLWLKWHRERTKQGISCRTIFSEVNSNYYNSIRMFKKTKSRVLTGVTPAAVDILGDRILILTYGTEPTCLSVKNKEIASSFTTFFESLWNISKDIK